MIPCSKGQCGQQCGQQMCTRASGRAAHHFVSSLFSAASEAGQKYFIIWAMLFDEGWHTSEMNGGIISVSIV